jgi:hypothetical protein
VAIYLISYLISDLSFYNLSEMIDIFLSFYDEDTFLFKTDELEGDFGEFIDIGTVD